MLPHILNKNGLFILKNVNRPIDSTSLNQLSSDRSRFLCLYKKFYRLRRFISNDQRVINRYVDTIRWKFTRENFNTRLSVILDEPQITLSETFERIINTLQFVNNATVAMEENVPEKLINFIQDVQQQERLEKLVINTILEMQLSKPNEIKYDITYQWFETTRRFYQDFPHDIPKKQFKSTLSTVGLIGFYNYELNVMMLNQLYKLIL